MSDVIARSTTPSVGTGMRVTLHFSLLLPNGDEIDSTRNAQPAQFVVGDGNLLPGFEAALFGQRAGYAEQILIPAAQAFGERNDANVQVLDRNRFADIDLEPGLIVSFQAPDGELPGVVQAVYERTVKVDFNHPLSGQDITFDVSILAVEEAQANPA
ncbi:MAG: peptidylprolyl isomerase [Pseudomonadota bacterium]